MNINDVRGRNVEAELVSRVLGLETQARDIQAKFNTDVSRSLTLVNGACEFLGASGTGVYDPWVFTALASGTLDRATGNANHPGIAIIQSSASANSGGSFPTYSTAFLLAGNEITELVFYMVNTGNMVVRFGFMDSFTNSAVVDGAYINIAATTLTGKTRSNSVESTTVSSYAISATTWYRARVVVDDSAGVVYFYLYDGATGALLWSDSLNANIPTAAGRETGHGVAAYHTAAGAVDIIWVDYMDLYCTRPLTR